MPTNAPKPPSRRSLGLLASLIWMVIAVAPRAAVAQDFVRYYELRMSDSPAGWMKSAQSSSGDLVTSQNEIRIRIKRGPIDLELEMTSEFVETAAGKPVSMKSMQKMGAAPMMSECVFGPTEITTTTEQSGRRTTTTKALSKAEWLPPAAAAKRSQELLTKGETLIKVSTIDPLSGPDVILITRKVLGKEPVRVGSKSVDAVKTTSEVSTMPGVTTVEYLDADGIPVRSETTMGGLKVTLIESGPEVVRAKIGESPELMVSTLVKPDRRIEHARTLRHGSYTLTNRAGALADLPQEGAQRFTRLGERSGRVSINLDDRIPIELTDDGRKEFLGASTLIDPADEAVKELVERALRGVPNDPRDRADALRRAVFKHIKKKSLGVGFASASETARTREGDCTEHGVLLAACLRAAGIPARVAAGLVYVDDFVGQSGIFGYHMWAQGVLEIDGKTRWVDLDAALDERHASDATHIAMGVSSLADDQAQTALATLAASLGSLDIAVESVPVESAK